MVKRFFRHLAVLPFEALVGGLAIYSGTLGLLNLGSRDDALHVLLPDALVTVGNAAYTLVGLAIVLGLGFGRADLEGFGLVGLIGSVVARFIAVVKVAGLAPALLPLTVLYVMIVIACLVRLRTLTKADTIVLLGSPPKAPAADVEENFGDKQAVTDG